jgi:hypothetical protein
MHHLDPKPPAVTPEGALGSSMVLADTQIRLDFAPHMVDI